MSAAPAVQPTRFIRAYVTPQVASTPKIAPRIVYTETGLAKIAQHMFSLMLRNVASDGFSFVDPNPLDQPPLSLPGCIIAAPSAPVNTAGINQDYVYNWTRDELLRRWSSQQPKYR